MEQAIQQILSTDQNTQEEGVRAIHSLTYPDPSERTTLAQDPRVIPRLGQLLTIRNDNCRTYAYWSLENLADVSAAVQLQITHALDAKALQWLDGYSNKKLLNKLQEKPGPKALLAAKRGKAQVVALVEDACKQKEDALGGAVIEVLGGVIDRSTIVVGGISSTEAEEVLRALLDGSFELSPDKGRDALSEYIHIEGVRQIVFRSLDARLTAPISDCLLAAQYCGDDHDAVVKRRLAVLWLANAIRTNEEKWQQIVAGGGVAVLVAELQREVFRGDMLSKHQELASSEMKRQMMAALANIMARTNSRSDVVGLGGLDSLLVFCKTSTGNDTKLVIGVLEQLMVDEGVYEMICKCGGMSILVRHLFHGSSDEYKLATLKVLRSIHLAAPNADITKKATATFGEGNGPTALYKIYINSNAAELRSTAKRLLQSLTQLIPDLLENPNIDNLCNLDVMSRVARNCYVIVKKDGINVLARVFKAESEDMKAPVIRILANLAYNNSQNRELIASAIELRELVSVFVNTATTHPVALAAAMALRNLSNDPSNGDAICASGAIPHAIATIRSADSLDLREVSAGLLGNLARQNHPVNQKLIAHWGGVAALLDFARSAANARQRQTAIMVLWILVKGSEECREQFCTLGGTEVVEQVEQLGETEPQPWIKRLLTRVLRRVEKIDLSQ